MKTSKLSVVALIALALVSLTFYQFEVQAKPKTIVVPDDYLTISWAISNASDGDTIFVKKGTYAEKTFTIDKTLELIGENANNTIIKNVDVSDWNPAIPFGPPPIVAAKINANNVKISGFTITCANGYWIPIEVTADYVQIVGNIFNKSDAIQISGDNNVVSQNSFVPSLRNDFIVCHGSNNSIESNNMVGIGSSGVRVGGDFNTICNNTLTGNLGGFGVTGNNNTISSNNITENRQWEYGLWVAAVYARGSTNRIVANRITNMGLIIEGNNNEICFNYITNRIALGNGQIVSTNNTFHSNSFVGNTSIQLGSPQQHECNFWDNGNVGNFWSDYEGTDLNNDGVGDVYYSVKGAYNDPTTSNRVTIACGQDNYPLTEPINIDYTPIPEFPLLIILPLFLGATLSVIVLRRKLF